jgi:NADH:ubiquinone oxidoreductase subunit 2 (subunit N)
MDGMMEMNMGRDLALLLPEITILITAVLALIAEMLHRPRWSFWLVLSGLPVAMFFTLRLLTENTTVFMGTFRIDPLSVWAKLILIPLVMLVVILAAGEHQIRSSDREGTVYSLLAFTSIGAFALAGAGDMMFLVLGVLLSSLGSFALVAYPRDDRATEAGMKYFVYGSVTEAVMIFGLTFWFGATGSTMLGDLNRLQNTPLPLAGMAGLLALLIGLGYKAALAPFHFWSPDAYDGSPVAVAAFLSTVPKIGAIFALAQSLRNLNSEAVNWPIIVALVATVSMTFGNLAALPQTNVIRLLAYSSITQTGYFLLAIIAVNPARGATPMPMPGGMAMDNNTVPSPLNPMAVQSLVVFAAAYAAMNLGAFALVARTGRNLSDWEGVGRTAPWTGAGMVIFLLSLVGVPPLAGFFGKLLLFGAALDTGYSWLAIVAILNSVLSLAVYLRIIVPMYQTSVTPKSTSQSQLNRLTTGVVWTTALLLTVGLGLGVQLIIGWLA